MSLRFACRPLLFFFASVGSIAAAHSQSSYQAVTFDFDRKGLAVSHWTVDLHADGSGTYMGEPVAGASAAERSIRAGKDLLGKLEAAYPAVRSGRCETKQKNIANTGHKTLSYKRGDAGADAACTFNFSDIETLNSVASAFISLAETLQAGDRLAQKHRYDRLGLDAELDSLADAVKNGRATELANIAPILQSIASDERVMERVQRKATRLLQDADISSASVDNAR